VPNSIDTILQDYHDVIDAYPKNPNFTNSIQRQKFITEYNTALQLVIDSINDWIHKYYPTLNLSNIAEDLVRDILYISVQASFIFESNAGIIFFGFGNDQLFPCTHEITLGSLIGSTIRYFVKNPVTIAPGIMESNIMPYAQSDVTYSVLTGMDPKFKEQVRNSITAAFTQAVLEVNTILNPGNLTPAINTVFSNISTKLLDDLNQYQHSEITNPILEMLVHMGKEDMAELAESLVNVTSLKRKFTEGFESVGGPVDVAVVTKGDGFVWMKRKQYFTEELNKNL
jgi:hypothetical protein